MHSREFLILAILIIFLLISCHIFEPDDENGSLLIEIASETTNSLSVPPETISSVRCLLSKGSQDVYDQEYTKAEEGKFSITIDNLKPADNYSVLLYGKNSSEAVVGRAYQGDIRIIARLETQISMAWTGMQPVLQTPADSSTISDETPSFTWSVVSSASFYALQVDSSNSFSSPVIEHSSLTSTGYTSPGALADNTYYWRVRCQDSEENWGGWSSTSCFTINTQGQEAPTLHSPADGSTIFNDTPSFTWSGVSGAASYALQVDISDNFFDPVINQSDLSDTSYTAASTLSEATYYWRVRCQDGEQNWGAWSDTWSFSINTQGPAAPTLTSPEDESTITDNTPSFTWSAVSAAARYELQVDLSDNFTAPVIDQSSLTTTGYTSPSALADTTYYWRVRSQDSEGNWGEWSDTWDFTINTQGPEAPTLNSPADGSTITDTTPSFTWSAVSNATYYQLQVDSSESFSSPVIDQSDLTSTSFTAASALADNMYYWRVRCQDSQDIWGVWSDTWSFRIDTQGPEAPTLTSPENESTITDTTLSFTWSAVSDAVTYQVQVDSSATFSAPVIDQSNLSSNSYIASSALADNTYYWRVRGQDSADNWGVWSDTWSFLVSTKSITVISPNGGESWDLGSNQIITWTNSNAGDEVDIELYKGNDLYAAIASGTFNDGSYNWSIPANYEVASNYQVKIASTSDTSMYDYSDGDFILYSTNYIRIYGVCFVYFGPGNALHIGDVNLTFDSDIGGTMSTTTNHKYGYYDQTVPYGWSGTVSASRPDYNFKCDYQGSLQKEFHLDNITQHTKVDFWDDRFDEIQTGTMTDQDGNVYKTVKIGDQWWMAENLRVTHYRNGDAIPNVTDDYEWEDLTTGAYCAYYNDESYVNTYGYLYNGFAVDSNKIALPGWRVPNDEDVHELITFLITTPPKVDFPEVQGTNAGGKLKDSGYDYWWDPNKGATNEYGFSALPGGYRYVDIYSKHSSFWEMSKIASFWNLLHWYDPNKASVGYINLHFDRSDILRVIAGDKHIGRSVRLVKED